MKEVHFRFSFYLSDAMSADKLPLTVENVMAEKDKVAEAAIRGESYDPFGIAESFEPAAAADAINAVMGAPSVSAPAGLERQTEVELVDKEKDKEKMMETQDEAERPKSPEPDWEMADPVPATDMELVGDLLKEQEEEDLAQFVFLSEWKPDDTEHTLKEVTSQLDDLTKHIQELSVGGDPMGTKTDLHGPQMDEPKVIAVEPAGDGLFRLTCFPDPFPHVSRAVANLLTGLTVLEVAQLFDLFQGKTLTRAGVERALECYVITKRSKDHENLLKRPYTSTKTKHGVGYTYMKHAEAGDPMQWLCPQCLTPRDQSKSTCLFCKSQETPIHRSEPTARMLVDGVEWTLRFDDEGNHHWEAPGISAEEKEAASIDLSQLAQAPSPCLNPEEASFADQVPQAVRISLRQQVVTEDPDPDLVEALAKKNVKMHTKEEENPREGSKVFHPAASKALKIKQAVMLEPVEPPKVDEAKIDEMVDLTTEVLGEMQSGALSVADKEARGAQLLRQLDMNHFRDCLKRSYLDGPGANIAQAQTTIEEARRQNLARQEAGVKQTKELYLKPEPFSAWSNKARAAFESNVFAPESDPQDAMAIDVDGVVEEYKKMKQFLLEGRRLYTPVLLSALPDTAKMKIEIDGVMVDNTHPQFKLAVMTRLCNWHWGELRQFGGVWRLAWGEYNPPAWAKKMKPQELTALERRTHPSDMPTWKFQPCIYSDQDIQAQVRQGLRPDPDTVVGGFWAPRDDVRHWSRQTQTWSLPALFHVYGNSWTMKELYGIWCEMPLVLKSPKRGAGPTMKEHPGNRQKIQDEVVQFLDANNLGRPQSSSEWRQCYRELGKFLAMKAFLTNTPQVVMEIPVAPISDTREHMIMRAICDERISLPMEAFKEYPEVYSKIAAVIPVGDMMDVKVAWRCNTSQYWHCEVASAEAGPIYHKLGYSPAAITAMGLNPYGGPITLTAQGAKILGEGGAYSPQPTPGSSSGGQHSKEPYCSIEADDGKTYEEARKPPITVHNAVSALGKDYMKKNYPGGGRHAFWGQMECGLVLSSVSPWEMVQKEKGVTRGGYVCKWCRGFWKGKMGSSRFLQITSGRTVLQLVLDEPPERLYNRWVKDRIEFYKRLEPTAPLRDVPLKVDPNPVHRLRFSVSNGMGNISDAIWSVALANPEKAGLEGIRHLADKHLQG